eukprot:TRINITY_DN44962_c0_g1_i5.p1 TRINITY_DN44962_c0_g1~~TRINITY_DN44962_c0_g1_i5.p1  ORF type:complete len:253 (+),score=50.84 TRINITY_DN44962_c0_g1_i5:159-917(+)
MSLTLASAVVVLMTSLGAAHYSVPVAYNPHNLYEIQRRYFGALSDLVWLDTEWALAFRLTTGVRQSAYDSYVDWGRNDDVALSRAFLPVPCPQHYRSGLLDHWPSRHIDQVKVSVMKAGKEVAYIRFNGTGSTALSWFSAKRVMDSTWTDLTSQPHNYFSIKGHFIPGQHSRRFYVNRNYGSCPGDLGWLSVQDQQYDVCSWGNLDDARPFPAILYSKKTTFARFQSADLGRADTLLVAVKFLPLSSDLPIC